MPTITNAPVTRLCSYYTFYHYSVFFVPIKNFAIKQYIQLLRQQPHTSVYCVSWLHHFLLGLINLVLFCTVTRCTVLEPTGRQQLYHTAIWPRCRVGSMMVAKWQNCLKTHVSEHIPLISGAWLYITFWKRQSWNSKKRSGCQGVEGCKMDEQVKRRGFLGNETILFDTIVVDTCQHIFVKTHRMYNTKNGP